MSSFIGISAFSSLWLVGEVGEFCGVNVGDTALSSILDTFATLSLSNAN